MTLLIVVGTRPEIIKMAPVIKEAEKRNIPFIFVHTGQHYDYEMSYVFIKELGLPEPDASFKLENHNPPAQIGEMMIKLEKAVEEVAKKKKLKIKLTLIQGDTNSMVAAGLTALKMGLKIGHVEAGLRSYDWRMPEEHNRRMIDHVSDYLYAPTEKAKLNLIEEHVFGKIIVTGNTVIDALDIYFDRVREVEEHVLSEIDYDEYILVTFHRSENVDNYNTLRNFVEILRRSPIPIVYPIHPRTRKRLVETGLYNIVSEIKHLKLLKPLGYFKFLALMKNAKLVMTDSGGLQEEATYPKIRKPVLVLRTSTERPEAVEAGFAYVVGTNPVVVLSMLKRVIDKPPKLPDRSPFGDGKASKRILDTITELLS